MILVGAATDGSYPIIGCASLSGKRKLLPRLAASS